MRLIPVIDVKSGQAVHAIAGRRHDYQPVQSCLSPSSDPLELAKAFRDQLGLRQVYVADLDAIGGQQPCVKLYAQLAATGMKLMIDPGIASVKCLELLADVPLDGLVIGLETLERPAALREILDVRGPDSTIFSLDLAKGHQIGQTTSWKVATPLGIAQEAIEMGIRRMIVLDLARVGTGQGIGTHAICRQILTARADLELIVGGGVQAVEDLFELRAQGISAVLVATALHLGQIDRTDIQRLAS